MGDIVGNFKVGKKLDCLVINVFTKDSPIDVFENQNLLDCFQKFLFLGDDRNIENIFIDGKKVI
jgi:guanine deaminase